MTNAASSSDKTPSFEKTWGSSTSSGYCSEEEPDSEFEQYFTARTSFFPQTRKANVNANVKKGVKCQGVLLSSTPGLELLCVLLKGTPAEKMHAK